MYQVAPEAKLQMRLSRLHHRHRTRVEVLPLKALGLHEASGT